MEFSSSQEFSVEMLPVLPEDVGMKKAQPQWLRSMPKDLQDSSHREEYDTFGLGNSNLNLFVCAC